MEKNRALLNVLFGCCVASAAVLVASGSILLVSKLTGDKTNMLRQVTFTSYDQAQQVTVFNDVIFPSESVSYRVEINSKLVENCRYSINFVNHVLKEEDKMFYISIYTESNPYLMNNTLAEVFTDGLSISNQVLPSLSKEDIYFEFSIDKELSRSVDFDFDIVFKSEGKLTY